MPTGKTTKSKQKKISSKKISKHEKTSIAEVTRQNNFYKYILNGLFFLYLLFYLFQLYASLDSTYFWADENKHAYISSTVFETHQIPVVLPEQLYGGFRWTYPPLFHILGALLIGIAGFSALKFFNLILLSIFFFSFYVLIRRHYGNSEAVISCILITLSPVLAINSVRFMTEMLTMLLTFFSFFFLLLALKQEKKSYAIMSGLFTGMLMLAKQTGIVVLGFYFLLLIWFLWKNKKYFNIMLYVVGASAGIFLPYLVWVIYHKVEAFHYLSVFLGFKEKATFARLSVKSFQRYDSSLKEFAYLFYKGNGLLLSISFLLPLYHFIRTRAKDIPQNYIFVLSVYLTLIMVIWHITNDRHTITLLPLITFLFSYALHQIITNKIIVRVTIVLLLIIAWYSTFHMPNYRQKFNGPEEFITLTEIIKKDNSPNTRTLCLYKFDALMYTQKPVIWPSSKLRNIPLDLMEKQSVDKFYSVLKKYQIKYILIDTRRIIKSKKYRSRTYPLYMLRACEDLERQGKLALEALSKSNNFILLKVI